MCSERELRCADFVGSALPSAGKFAEGGAAGHSTKTGWAGEVSVPQMASIVLFCVESKHSLQRCQSHVWQVTSVERIAMRRRLEMMQVFISWYSLLDRCFFTASCHKSQPRMRVREQRESVCHWLSRVCALSWIALHGYMARPSTRHLTLSQAAPVSAHTQMDHRS